MNSYDHIKGSELRRIQVSVGWLLVWFARLLFPVLLLISIYTKLTEEASDNFDYVSIVAVILLVILLLFIIGTLRYGVKKPKNFSFLKNLITGSIDTNLEFVPKAYEFFKSAAGIRVISVNDEIETNRRVCVRFLFNDAVMGTMLFRISEQLERHQAAEFMEKLDRANKII